VLIHAGFPGLVPDLAANLVECLVLWTVKQSENEAGMAMFASRAGQAAHGYVRRAIKIDTASNSPG
jgi:hypothetical protein